MKSLTRRTRLARDYNHRCFNTGHVLLGLLSTGEGIAYRALTDLGYNYETLLHAFQAAVQHLDATSEMEGDIIPPDAHVQLRTYQALWSFPLIFTFHRAMQEAGDDEPIAPEHLLLALLRIPPPDSISSQMLSPRYDNFKVNVLDRIRYYQRKPVDASVIPYHGLRVETTAPGQSYTLSQIRQLFSDHLSRVRPTKLHRSPEEFLMDLQPVMKELIQEVFRREKHETVNNMCELQHAFGLLILLIDQLALRLGISLDDAVRIELIRNMEFPECSQPQ